MSSIVLVSDVLMSDTILIGSWAEYLYKFHLSSSFKPNLKTRDVDFLYLNLNRPNKKINLSGALKEKGFTYTESPISGIGKFIKEDLLEVEFLTRVLGKGELTYKIPSINITTGGLRDVNMLANYPLKPNCNSYIINVSEPEAYVLQKLVTNPTRLPTNKKEKDIIEYNLIRVIRVKFSSSAAWRLCERLFFCVLCVLCGFKF